MENKINSIADSAAAFLEEYAPTLSSVRALLAASILSASACGGASIPVKDLDSTPHYSLPDSDTNTDADTDTDTDADSDTDTPTTGDSGTTVETGDTGGTTVIPNDSDGDLFSDAYETAQGTDPLDATSKPNLTVTVMGNRSVLGVVDANNPLYTEFAPSHDYTQTTELVIQPGVPAKLGIDAEFDNGAFAFEYNEADYLGAIEAQYCGTDSGLWPAGAVDSAVCTPMAGEFTEMDATLLNAWTSTLDAVYDSTSFDRWFQHNPSLPYNDYEYPVVALELQ